MHTYTYVHTYLLRVYRTNDVISTTIIIDFIYLRLRQWHFIHTHIQILIFISPAHKTYDKQSK